MTLEVLLVGASASKPPLVYSTVILSSYIHVRTCMYKHVRTGVLLARASVKLAHSKFEGHSTLLIELTQSAETMQSSFNTPLLLWSVGEDIHTDKVHSSGVSPKTGQVHSYSAHNALHCTSQSIGGPRLNDYWGPSLDKGRPQLDF